MSINFDKALGIHPQAIKLRAQRAQVLANNMANSNTPNFKARDVDFKAILRGEAELSQGRTTMGSTHSKHMLGQGQSFDSQLLYRTPMQPSLDGNTVEEQVEHSKFMENTLAFQASFTFLNSKFRGLMSAIKGE